MLIPEEEKTVAEKMEAMRPEIEAAANLLPGEGEVEIVTRKRARRECDECGDPADFRVTWLLDNARRNPASSAYRHDDCSWCSDAEGFACKAHRDKVWNKPPDGMGICSAFPADRFPHMVLYWKEVSKVKSPSVV